LQRKATSDKDVGEVPQIVYDVLRSPGQPLDPATRAFFEPRFGHDFSRVRVHADQQASDSAKRVNAKAYTVGRDIAFGAGEYAPTSSEGTRLLAHELTHVVQNGPTPASFQPREGELRIGENSSQIEEQAVSSESLPATVLSVSQRSRFGASVLRKPTVVGKKQFNTKKRPAFKRINSKFNGRELELFGDGQIIFRVAGKSGRPELVAKERVEECDGSLGDIYMNNPRYQAYSHGTIPEGTYTFDPRTLVTYSNEEQKAILESSNNEFIDVHTRRPIKGDWGAGRVLLNPSVVEVVGCSKESSKRDGFFIHGGVREGSGGCIDIGNDGINRLAEFISGYVAPIQIDVTYETPEASQFTKLLQWVKYPRHKVER